VPLWAFHGQKDTNVAFTESQRAVAALAKCGGSPRLTLYPEEDHAGAWERAYADLALWE
jgi:dipeptidyl aminopeptidase/acylaminoacyl peptidase